ncbi:MAG: PHP domain-containing protein, partial [Candidatus Reddybacter sp.]
MKYDLHCHTTASDGALSPNALIARAIAADVDVLAITDHDTLAAYREIDHSALGQLTLVPGTELSSQWQKNNVHIVGLNMPLECSVFAEAIASQQRSRIERASIIA